MSVSVYRANGKHASARDRTREYLGIIDAILPTMPPPQRAPYLQSRLNWWEEKFRRFVASEGDSEPYTPDDPATAADFLLTISGLAARLVAERGQ